MEGFCIGTVIVAGLTVLAALGLWGVSWSASVLFGAVALNVEQVQAAAVIVFITLEIGLFFLVLEMA